ncbi:MAG: hypothetical protein R6V46_13490 [Desulfatiglandaceae bacterium]
MTGACAFLILVVLGAFIWVKMQSDMFAIWASLIGLVLVFVGEKFSLKTGFDDYLRNPFIKRICWRSCFR